MPSSRTGAFRVDQGVALTHILGTLECRETAPDRGPRSRVTLLAVAVYVVAALPLLLSLISLPHKRYVPIGDDAATLFRLHEVGSSQTPLVGSYSTRGWAHPGPAHFYLLTPIFRLLGSKPWAMAPAAVAVHLAALALVLVLALRRRGKLGLLISAATCAALLHGLHPETYVRAWNPHMPLLLYFAFLLSIWSVAERDFVLVPVAIGLGSVIVQMHVAYLALTAGAGIGVAVALLSTRRSGTGQPLTRGASTSAFTRRATIATALIGVIIWLPPLCDLLVGDGNLFRLARYFRHVSPEAIGFHNGFGILCSYVSLQAWVGGQERLGPFGVRSSSPVSFLFLLGVLLLLTLLSRRRRSSGAVGIVAMSQLLAAVVVSGRVEGLPLRYLVVWMLPLAGFCYLACLTMAFDLLIAGRPLTKAVRASLTALVAGVGALSMLLTVRPAWTTEPPDQDSAAAVESDAAQLRRVIQPGEPVRVEGVGDYFNLAWVGVLYALSQHDRDFYTSDGAAGQKWGRSHRWVGQPVATTVTIATTGRDTYDDPVSRCQHDTRVRQIATWDPLTPAERLEFRQLLMERYNMHGHPPQASVTRYAALSPRSLRLVVFEGPVVCGTP